MEAGVSELTEYAIRQIGNLMPMAEVTVSRHKNCAGYSNYVSFYYQRINRFVHGKLRISDHSVGDFRMATDTCVYISSYKDVDMYLASAVSHYDWLQNAGTEIIFMRNGSIADIDITTLKDIGNGAFLAKRLSDGVTIKCYKVVRIAK